MTRRNALLKKAHGFWLWIGIGLMTAWGAAPSQAAWKPAQGPLMTRWAKDVSPRHVHREYPRPQMVRDQWNNLNGLWDYAVTPKDAPRPSAWDGQILVPFPVESALSGVMRRVDENQRLWYRRTFPIPRKWRHQQMLLHFGAVDWETTVYVNGREIGTHCGGYDAFQFDITSALKTSGDQELVVAVWDPTDAGTQPRGKQVREPRGIWYTPTSGIWQTVWLEPVAPIHLVSCRITPLVDEGMVRIEPVVAASPDQVASLRLEVTVLEEKKRVATGVHDQLQPGSSPSRPLDLAVPQAKLWSPDSPFLYDLKLRLLDGDKEVDAVTSYFGMRKIALGKDQDGLLRLFLNNRPLFQYGPLDQGFWPDGLYTAPTDEALRYDIEVTKQLGFNMARKHVKIEPARWYYWCDRLGLLVWQDMPSGDRSIRRQDPDIQRSPASGQQFETELKAMVDGFYNHPSIVMWVPYNEGWGQWDSPRIASLLKQWDPTRLVNHASGWTDRGVGDVHDIHRYPGPDSPPPEEHRAVVLGEFGGLGLPVRGHTWQDEKNWGYRSYPNAAALTQAYVQLINKLHPLTGAPGLAAAVYTQTTDVEIEVNGLMTYDRALIKMDAEEVQAANRQLSSTHPGRRAAGDALIPPATPLVTCDPYFSVWSFADRLTDDVTRHWTGTPHALASLVRIDGRPYRLMGPDPAEVLPLPSTGLEVHPTRTLYHFEGAGLHLTLTFATPMLPDDLDLLSRPVTYLTWEARATDGKSHRVELYFDNTAELVVNEASQNVVWTEEKIDSLVALKMGSKDQPVLGKSGDNLRIDWGYLYTAAPAASLAGFTVANAAQSRAEFCQTGQLPLQADQRMPRPANEDWPASILTFDLGPVGPQPVSRWLMLAYDDLYSIQYFKKNLRPFWRRHGWEASDLLQASAAQYQALQQRCAAFDQELMNDLRQAGGVRFAKLAALAYRQALAANKFVADANGQPLSFSKENFSNGCIGTVDVFYPMAPQFLLFGPSLTKSMLMPLLNYANSERWRFPFAPHDLGTYPLANGQRYGGGERSEENQMPVEETGNMLILLAALAQMEGHADFAGQFWPLLTRWAAYLKDKGFDPENQLCTDDFAGHLAHNVNLSAKAICGLAAFAKLAALRGEQALADEYQNLARQYAAQWIKEADDGDHFRLAFDKPGTWSQKYNLVWDRILQLNLWPDSVRQKEMDYYQTVQNRYGLPLDNRSQYTKLDWILWTATLTQNRADFDALVNPVFDFLNETPDRVPMTDWYWTHTGRVRGFQARPVVGGVFIPMLYHPDLWNKHARRDQTQSAQWAPFPKPPLVKTVVATSEEEPQTWRFTTQSPGEGWAAPSFDDASWQEGPGGFGTRNTPGTRVRTEWNTREIWLRRTVTLPEGTGPGTLQFRVHHDEDVTIFINGVAAASAGGYATAYEELPINPAGLAALKPGPNVIAVHCRQSTGGQYIDVGLAEVIEQE